MLIAQLYLVTQTESEPIEKIKKGSPPLKREGGPVAGGPSVKQRRKSSSEESVGEKAGIDLDDPNLFVNLNENAATKIVTVKQKEALEKKIATREKELVK